MSMNSNSIRSIGLLMTLLMSIILIGSPSLVAAESESMNEVKITASDATSSDYFGNSVAISGDTMVVGAYYDGGQRGAAYIFERDAGGTWGEVTKVSAFDVAPGDYFGKSVAISGDTIVIGAYSDDHNNISRSGSAYIFSRDKGGENNWGEVKKVTAFDAADSDFFGKSVAISGDTVVVGADGDGDDNAYDYGSAYIFKRNEDGTDNWGLTQKVTASDAASTYRFGHSVAISDDIMVVGATRNRSAYVFERDANGTWSEIKKLTGSGSYFGYSVAINGDTVVVGVGNDNYGSGASNDAAYIFDRDQGGSNNWGEVKKITASDKASYDAFGRSVAISGDTVVVGAYLNDDQGPDSDSGSVYVFERNQGGTNNWGEVQKITASDAAEDDYFGYSVATNGSSVVIGAYKDDDNASNSGSAYIYQPAGPQLSLPNDVTQLASDGASLTVPISLISNANDVASLGFSLDYDQTCLSFDHETDSDGDDVPDAITGLQAAFNINVSQSLDDTDGELDIAIFSSPVIALVNGTVLNLTFEVDASCVSETSVGLSFSTDPTVSFGNMAGESVAGTVATDGPIEMNIAPSEMSLSSDNVDEEEAIGTTVGTLSTVDLNSSDTHTYSLVSGVGATDNSSFTLESNGELKTNVIFDFEQEDSFSIRVSSDDGRGATVEKPFAITINDTPDAPTALNLSNLTIIENEEIGTAVGILSTIDPDSNDTHTYSLVSGSGNSDNTSFEIVDDTLKNKEVFDYDAKNSYSVRLRTTDSANKTFEQEFTITVIGNSELSLTHSGEYLPTVSLTGQTVNATLQFEPKGNSVSQVDLSLDYDQNCLQFSSIGNLPNGFTSTDNDQPSSGKLSISLDGGANVLTAGDMTTVEFVAKDDCASGLQTEVLFSSDTPVTLADTEGLALPSVSAVSGSVTILSNDSRGDCNIDSRVDAGDFPAIVLEIFDNDEWLNAHQSTFVGSAIGCDANSDQLIAVSDIICSVLVFFGDNSCTNAQPQRSAAKKAALSVAPIDAKAGQSVQVPIKMSSNGNQIAAAAFSLEFDQETFSFDPADNDGNGIPDAITINLPNGALNSASFDAQNNRLDFVVGHIALRQRAIADGTIATVTLQLKESASNATIGLTNASLSDTKGRNVSLTTRND